MLILVSKDNSKWWSYLQVPISSQSQAVAGSTELLGHRGDESDLCPFWHQNLTYEIREPDLAQKAGYFPPLRRVVWSVFHPLERGERLPDDLQHLLRVKVRSDTLSCDCAELDQPDMAPSFPCSNGCRRKACTRWNGHRCCWKKRNCLCIWIQSLVRIILRWRVIDSLVPGFLNKIDDLVFVQAPHDHTVHLATLVTRRILSCRFEKLLWTK